AWRSFSTRFGSGEGGAAVIWRRFFSTRAPAAWSASCGPTWRRFSEPEEHGCLGAGPACRDCAQDEPPIPGIAPVLRDGAVPLPLVQVSARRPLRAEGSAHAARVGRADGPANEGHRSPRPPRKLA